VPNSEIQQALDTALERARDGAKARFAKSLAELDTVPDATKPLPEGSAPAEDETAAVSRLTATPSSAIMSREVADAADGDPMGWLQVGYEATSTSRCASRSHRLLNRRRPRHRESINPPNGKIKPTRVPPEPDQLPQAYTKWVGFTYIRIRRSVNFLCDLRSRVGNQQGATYGIGKCVPRE